MNRLLRRRPILILLTILFLVSLVPALVWFNAGRSTGVHAASATPTIQFSLTTIRPNAHFLVTGQGFLPNDTINLDLDGGLSGTNLGNVPCDSSGNCSGTLQLPQYAGPAGLHTIYAYGNGGVSDEASATITINPVVYTSGGGPGTSVNLSGAGFAASETVQVYWGKSASGISEGSFTTDSSIGSLSAHFTIPTNLTPGPYPITVVRTGQKPASITGVFQIIPPAIKLAKAGIRSQQPVTVALSGFQANESVTLSWNANGGAALGTFTMDNAGSNQATVTPPFAALGTYTLTAVGGTSKLSATASLAIGPGLLIQPNVVTPGGTLNITGGGFTPNETVNVYVPQGGVYNGYTDATGTFNVTATAPLRTHPKTSYTVYADSASGTDKASAQYSYITPQVSCQNANSFNCETVPYGVPVTLSGQGFFPDEHVTLYWNYQQTGQVKMGTVQAGPDGAFSVGFTVPSSPSNLVVDANLEAVGSTSKLQAGSQVQVTPGIVLTPSTGALGKKLTIKGGSFYQNDSITVTFGQYTEATVTADSSGAFVTSFVTPTNVVGGGIIFVQATDSSGRIKPSSDFTVPPTFGITPTTGASGTTITLNGTNLGANYYYSIDWIDTVSGTLTNLGNVSADTQGNVTTSITAPANLVKGRSYTITLIGGSGNSSIQATFKAS